MKNRGCVADAFLELFWEALGARTVNSLVPFGMHFPSKIRKIAYDSVKGSPNGAKSLKTRRLNNDVKNDAEKDANVMPKGSQNDAKMDAEINKKSMRFRNLRFLCFCREYNVKIVFLHES